MEDLDRIPKKSNIRVKEQDGKYVIFNLETSGFHMIEKDAMDVINKIDGKKTVRELAEMFSKERNINLEELEKDFVIFFNDLAVRKIVEL
jgi:hypothetical protein